MRLEARESLVADQEKLSEIALSRSMALDRREADLKAREEHLARTLSKHHARYILISCILIICLLIFTTPPL